MKSTGVVRRIDLLGRIVIPKEIRNTLRIHEGEQLEIFIDQETIKLKKFSTLCQINNQVSLILNAIYRSTKTNIFVTDRDVFLATTPKLEESLLNKQISTTLNNIIIERKNIESNDYQQLELCHKYFVQVNYIINPIIVNGDVIGLVGIISNDKKIDEIEKKILNIVTEYLCKNVEE